MRPSLLLLLLLLSLLLCVCVSPACLPRSWMYVAGAYGANSRQLAHAVWRDRAFGPLDRFPDVRTKKGVLSTKQRYVEDALRWGALRSWNPRARSTFDWAEKEEDLRSEPLSDEDVNKLSHFRKE